MNDVQQVFMVFLAIFWGVSGNVQGRWKAFHQVCPLPRTQLRWGMSFIVLNLLPIGYCAVVIHLLHGTAGNIAVQEQDLNLRSAGKIAVFGIFPAFAAFGFYRLWLSIVELKITCFYYEFPEQFRKYRWSGYAESEPTIESLYYPLDDNKRSNAVRACLSPAEAKLLGLAAPSSPSTSASTSASATVQLPSPANWRARKRHFLWGRRLHLIVAAMYLGIPFGVAFLFRVLAVDGKI